MQLTREIDSLCEVVFDISTTMNQRLNGMEDGDRDALMESIDGSRGLFWQHVYLWAQEYHTAWEALTPEQRDEKSQNYIGDIDEFTAAKFKALLAGQVASIQVLPSIINIGGGGVTPQFDGPDEQTQQWSVYERGRDGLARWVADFSRDKKDYAMRFGHMLAAQYGVEIEPQAWKALTKPQAEVVQKMPSPTERFHVSWHIDLDAADARAAALEALAIQRDSLSTATVFDVRDDNGNRAVRIDLWEKAE